MLSTGDVVSCYFNQKFCPNMSRILLNEILQEFGIHLVTFFKKQMT